jgi:integrase
MATRLTDAIVKTLAPPDGGNRIAYDASVKGFGVRVTAAGARSFILTYRIRTGRQRRYTIGTFPDWSTAAARQEAVRLKRLVDTGEDPLGEIKAGREAPTIADLCQRFEADYLPRRAPSTQATYKGQIASEILPALGRLKVAEMTFADVDAFHRKITKRGRRYRANRVLALLSRMFTLAIKWGWRTDNPCRGVERNPEHKRRRYLSGDELGRLSVALAAHKDKQAANIIRLLLLTGARRSEVLSARWQDIDLEKGVWAKPGATTKQRTEHIVPLSEAARQLLGELHGNSNQGFVFPARSGEGHRADVQSAWKAICRKAEIDGARLHDLRHTYASILASSGLSLPVIGALLGHTQPATTARYAHLYDDLLRAAAERAAAIVTGKPTAEILPLKKSGVQ